MQQDALTELIVWEFM